MSEDDLEPGQDDLVKEDKASTAFRRVLRGAKNAGPGRSGTDERIYSDPEFTSDPDAFVKRKPPKLRQDRKRRERPAQPNDDASDWTVPPTVPSDAAESADLPKKPGRLSSLKQVWKEALSEAEAKQRAKRDKKG